MKTKKRGLLVWPVRTISKAEFEKLYPQLETDFHVSVAQYLDAVLSITVAWTTFPAGGGGLARGAELKRKGLKPGWPDIIIMWRPLDVGIATLSRFLGIELKTVDGVTSADQDDAHGRISVAGGSVRIARSLDDIERILQEERVPLRGCVVRTSSL